MTNIALDNCTLTFVGLTRAILYVFSGTVCYFIIRCDECGSHDPHCHPNIAIYASTQVKTCDKT